MDNHIVTESSAYLRTLARGSLKGNWLQAAIVMGIYVVMIGAMLFIVENFLLSNTAVFLSNIYFWIVFGPATMGMFTYLMKLSKQEERSISDAFAGFEDFIRSFLLGLLMMLFIFLWSLLFLIPGIVAAYRYSLAPMLVKQYPEMDPLDCISASKRLTMGNKWSLFKLDISFIGWAILACIPYSVGVSIAAANGITGVGLSFVLLILQIPALWVMAYNQLSTVKFYEEVIRIKPGQTEYQYHRYEGNRNDSNQNYGGGQYYSGNQSSESRYNGGNENNGSNQGNNGGQDFAQNQNGDGNDNKANAESSANNEEKSGYYWYNRNPENKSSDEND